MASYTWRRRPTSNISIEFESRPKFEVLWVKMYSADHNEILFMSRQFHCCDVCKISLRSVWHILNYSTLNVDRISNSIEILLVGRGPGSPLVLVVCLALCQQCWLIMDWTHRDNLDRNLIKNTTDFVQENAVENVFCKSFCSGLYLSTWITMKKFTCIYRWLNGRLE